MCIKRLEGMDLEEGPEQRIDLVHPIPIDLITGSSAGQSG
jgi:hypothetical protein